MLWSNKQASFGDIVRVRSGEIYHYGIYVSDVEVIQFGVIPSRRENLKDNDIEVLATDIEYFLDGGRLEVGECDTEETKKKRSPELTVSYARERIGTKGYNIIHNNCEHFANECLLGERKSEQEDMVRQIFRRMMAEKMDKKV